MHDVAGWLGAESLAGLIEECMMPEFILQQSDGAPVRFDGELVAEIGPPGAAGPYARWYELKIYRTKSNRFVLEVIFKSNAKNSRGEILEPEQHDVFVCDNEDEVRQELQDFDPLEPIVGFPPLVQDADKKNTRLRKSVLAEYESNVGKLLTEAVKKYPGFAEEI